MGVQYPRDFLPSDLIMGQGGWVDHMMPDDGNHVDAADVVELTDYLFQLLVGYVGPWVAVMAFDHWMTTNDYTFREHQAIELTKRAKKVGSMV